ncbi:jasmonate-induced protein homolog [Chenopodium quinoa]|uniref:jasmonate-induced protein homolog n=1 Tax=Chenopodium quinoa TaxID=63459 RepID=UPI000B78A294|nr:jasmonate-induced protein homolog [Chenopodium quinoa]
MSSAIVMNGKKGKNVDETIELAKTIIASSKSYVMSQLQYLQNSVVVSLSNSTLASIRFSRSKDWYGIIVPDPAAYPSVIPSKDSASFIHHGYGSQGAIVYFGTNKLGVQCVWLLAWAAPTDPSSTPNRVHVECGRSTNYTSIDWNTILNRLNASPTYNYFKDSITNATIAADINPNGSFALITADFGAV